MKPLAVDSGYIVLGHHSPQWLCIYEAAVAVKQTTREVDKGISTRRCDLFGYINVAVMKSSIWVYYK